MNRSNAIEGDKEEAEKINYCVHKMFEERKRERERKKTATATTTATIFMRKGMCKAHKKLTNKQN